jgi:hypothetical protein
MTRRVAMVLALAATAGSGVVSEVRAQSTGLTASAVLSLPATARTLGLGGAYTAVVGDEGSIFVNPAGLAPIRTVALGMSYQRYLLDSYMVSAAAAFRVSRFDVGIGINVLDFGQDTVYRPDPAFGGDQGVADPGGAMVGAYSAEAVGSVAYRFGMFSVGASAKYLQDHLSMPDTALYDASGVAFDAGAALAFFDIAAFGVVIQNMGGDLKTSTGTAAPLPRTLRAGFSLNVVDPQGTPRLMVVGDWVSPRHSTNYWVIGVEGGAVSDGVGLLGRVGVATGRTTSDQRAVVFGGSLVFHAVQLDYGYQGFSALGGGTSRFGVRWSP